jgi:hypothetical protein
MRPLIALMMEAARTSETLVIFYQNTRSYNPEDSHLGDYDVGWDGDYDYGAGGDD